MAIKMAAVDNIAIADTEEVLLLRLPGRISEPLMVQTNHFIAIC